MRKRLRKKLFKKDLQTLVNQPMLTFEQAVLLNALDYDRKIRRLAIQEALSPRGRPWVKCILALWVENQHD